jgi:hypothetical protein
VDRILLRRWLARLHDLVLPRRCAFL